MDCENAAVDDGGLIVRPCRDDDTDILTRLSCFLVFGITIGAKMFAKTNIQEDSGIEVEEGDKDGVAERTTG